MGWIATSLNMLQPMLPMKCCHGVTVSTSQRKRVCTQLFTFAKWERWHADGTGQVSSPSMSCLPADQDILPKDLEGLTHTIPILRQTLTKYLYLITWFPGDSCRLVSYIKLVFRNVQNRFGAYSRWRSPVAPWVSHHLIREPTFGTTNHANTTFTPQVGCACDPHSDGHRDNM